MKMGHDGSRFSWMQDFWSGRCFSTQGDLQGTVRNSVALSEVTPMHKLPHRKSSRLNTSSQATNRMKAGWYWFHEGWSLSKTFSNQDHQELTKLLYNGDMPSKCIFQACSSRVSCCSFSFSASLFRFPPFRAGASSVTFTESFNQFQRCPFAAKACTNRPCHGALSPLAQQPCNIQMQWKYAQITNHLMQNIKKYSIPNHCDIMSFTI